jgi:hypothetical protein
MLCWDEQTKDVKIVRWPDAIRASKGYSAVGANCNAFRKMPKAKRQLAMITEAMWLVQNSAIPIANMYAALMQIDECREALTKDPFYIF